MSSEDKTIQFLLSQVLKPCFSQTVFSPPIKSSSLDDTVPKTLIFSGDLPEKHVTELFGHSGIPASEPLPIFDGTDQQYHLSSRRDFVAEDSEFVDNHTNNDFIKHIRFNSNDAGFSGLSDHLKLQSIVSLVERKGPRSQKTKRIRTRETEIKILYAIGQFNKNLKNRGWNGVYPCKWRIAKAAKVSVKAVTQFINDPDFEWFCNKEYRFDENGYQTSNIYFLHQWVIDFFDLFEKKGMMKYFTSDFKTWKENFLKRCEGISKVLESKEISLRELLMNKLSTKNKLKGASQNPLKGASIKPSGNKAFQGSKSNIELPVLNDAIEIAGKLANDFSLKEGDINFLMSRYSIAHHKNAIRRREEYTKNGIIPRSELLLYQSCLNKTKPLKRSL